MNPDAPRLWRGPRWALAVLLACLGMLGPFSIDTYLPAFAGIARSLDATPLQMQQTLSAYLAGFALMNLFHGALADSFGRRPVVLAGLGLFTLASLGCALSPSIGWLVFFRAIQGMSAGAGVVVSRAIIRDMYPPADAQRVMSQVTIYFGVAPAIAPMIGGFLFVHADWHSIFWLLVLIGAALWAANWRWLPETLHADARQSFHPAPLLRGYWDMVRSARFMALVFASGVPFNGMFLYVLSAPVFVGEHLGLPPQQFFWFFLFTIGGIMGGAWASGRAAGKLRPHRQIRFGFTIMAAVSVLNVGLNLVFKAEAWWAMPLIGIFSFGWALMVPVVTLMVLDLVPERRGMASSVQACVGSAANALVAGLIAPLVMHSTAALALTSFALMSVGIVAWHWVRPRLA
ncbi:multidrug effflux MFS transporter [Rubrivivax gelatinosus]|uniref:Bcr/CflA family efflux transporter n=1 Tax=Rubrivivax gelatinosus TaxID=28068 RepID=A0A4R2MAA6_RUBGE|nr:multidrug effflux MFS transporter [Rubrivivax gelatinosus]MBK1689617.1 Bcr/CflA family drug resistance efflux transporter [Rubrivivax gelatinosus]TCP01244.1 DHA1 family bicyclomycin/chloramphenicol resistance-like MFS transporter [Rubrivivax gelatinosus]